jgi:hypothetical protein
MEETKVIEALVDLGYTEGEAKMFIGNEREKRRNVQNLEKQRAAQKKKKKEKDQLLRNLF